MSLNQTPALESLATSLTEAPRRKST
jgi:hypothetical protein